MQSMSLKSQTRLNDQTELISFFHINVNYLNKILVSFNFFLAFKPGGPQTGLQRVGYDLGTKQQRS